MLHISYTINHKSFMICHRSVIYQICFNHMSYAIYYMIMSLLSYLELYDMYTYKSTVIFFVTISNNMEQQPAKMLFMLKGTYVVLWNTVHWLATSVHSIQSPRQGTAKHWSFPQEITMLHSCKPTMSWWDTYDSDILNQIAKRFSCKVCLIQESLSRCKLT